MVTREDVGFILKSSTNSGIEPTASGKVDLKNLRISSSDFTVLKDSDPSKGKKSVQVKLPSIFGSAIIMKLSRGQMCSAFFSSANAPARPAGICSSLYP